jgi:hypothetical protein
MTDLTRGQTPSIRRIIIKAMILFIAFNVLYVVAQPLSLLNRLTVYNLLVPGRERLPFGEYPLEAFSIVGTSLDQMLASHRIAAPRASSEFRVAHIGDSGVWGYLVGPEQTQAACLDRLGLTLPGGQTVRVYNLGYPTLTVVKDVLILRRVLEAYRPDLILWSVTLASLYPGDQLDFPIIHAQRDEVAALRDEYVLSLPQWPLPESDLWDHTLFGQRRALADWLRYQLYGLGWAATGIDQAIPRFVMPLQTALQPDDSLKSVNVVSLTEPGRITAADLALDVMRAGFALAATYDVPILLVNEPIYRSETSDRRWNSYYPRWAYDDYRDVMRDVAAAEGWTYLDLWDAAPNSDFTDTEFHLSPEGNCAFAAQLAGPILTLAESPRPARAQLP